MDKATLVQLEPLFTRHNFVVSVALLNYLLGLIGADVKDSMKALVPEGNYALVKVAPLDVLFDKDDLEVVRILAESFDDVNKAKLVEVIESCLKGGQNGKSVSRD